MNIPMRFTWLALLSLMALPGGSPSGTPWDKPPEQWDQADAYRILRDSPWSPAEVKLEASYTQRHLDPLTGVVSDSPLNSNNTNLARGAELSRSKPLPDVPVLWWSSRTIRLAQQRLHQLRDSSGAAAAPLRADVLPDYVLSIEGSEPLRIFRDAKEDLHDTVFLELPDGLTLDLANVLFFEGAGEEEARVELHFPRQVEGHPAIDPDAERVLFHCKVTAKSPRPGRQNALAFRVEFHPRAMRVRGSPDL